MERTLVELETMEHIARAINRIPDDATAGKVKNAVAQACADIVAAQFARERNEG